MRKAGTCAPPASSGQVACPGGTACPQGVARLAQPAPTKSDASPTRSTQHVCRGAAGGQLPNSASTHKRATQRNHSRPTPRAAHSTHHVQVQRLVRLLDGQHRIHNNVGQLVGKLLVQLRAQRGASHAAQRLSACRGALVRGAAGPGEAMLPSGWAVQVSIIAHNMQHSTAPPAHARAACRAGHDVLAGRVRRGGGVQLSAPVGGVRRLFKFL